MSYPSKQQLTEKGVKLAYDFCKHNRIPLPRLLTQKDHHNGSLSGIYYSNTRTIKVWPEACAKMSVRYSWPGLFCDRTPYGVIQHELGHHVHEIFASQGIARVVCGTYRDKEDPITGYAPNVAEKFAEFFRLFVTNPGLLQAIRPLSYNRMLYFVKPIVMDNCLDVMKKFDAPAYVIDRIYKNFRSQKTKKENKMAINKNKGLGRGIASLIPSTTIVESTPPQEARVQPLTVQAATLLGEATRGMTQENAREALKMIIRMAQWQLEFGYLTE